MPALGTRKLKLRVGTTDFSDAVYTAKIDAAEKDGGNPTFAEAAAGGAREYKLVLTMRQNTDATALWYYLWNSTGTDVAVEVWPNGQNTVAPTTPTATFPKVSGTVTVREPDGTLLGGDANASSTSYFTSEVEWTFTAKPILAIA